MWLVLKVWNLKLIFCQSIDRLIYIRFRVRGKKLGIPTPPPPPIMYTTALIIQSQTRHSRIADTKFFRSNSFTTKKNCADKRRLTTNLGKSSDWWNFLTYFGSILGIFEKLQSSTKCCVNVLKNYIALYSGQHQSCFLPFRWNSKQHTNISSQSSYIRHQTVKELFDERQRQFSKTL